MRRVRLGKNFFDGQQFHPRGSIITIPEEWDLPPGAEEVEDEAPAAAPASLVVAKPKATK